MENNLKIEIDSNLDNVAVVRIAISSFISNIDITIDDLMDIKTAVSEAVTNAIEHGYEDMKGTVIVECKLISEDEDKVIIKVIDYGLGIGDIEMATAPTYTSKPELEHAGLGFTIMESFMDNIEIDSRLDEGTIITLVKTIKKRKSN